MVKEYINTGDDINWIEYDTETNHAKIINKDIVIFDISKLQEVIDNSVDPTDEELLEWAKLNYPKYDGLSITKVKKDKTDKEELLTKLV